MFHLLLAIIYLAFISLGLPDSLLGSAWPSAFRADRQPHKPGLISAVSSCHTGFNGMDV